MRLLATLATLTLLPACAVDSNWYLMDSGYSIHPITGESQAYAIEVHLNQLRQLGGDIKSANFRRYVSERLKWHGMCPSGWEPSPCVLDGSCVQHTSRSVTVTGRCVL